MGNQSNSLTIIKRNKKDVLMYVNNVNCLNCYQEMIVV